MEQLREFGCLLSQRIFIAVVDKMSGTGIGRDKFCFIKTSFPLQISHVLICDTAFTASAAFAQSRQKQAGSRSLGNRIASIFIACYSESCRYTCDGGRCNDNDEINNGNSPATLVNRHFSRIGSHQGLAGYRFIYVSKH